MGTTRALDRSVAFARRVVVAVRDENVSFMAGSLAYYAFVSLFPLAALVVFGLVFVGGRGFAERVVSLTGVTLSPTVDTVLQRTLLDGAASGAVSASVIGFVTLLWGALRLFRSLNTAFAEIYETEDDATFVGGLVDGAVVLGTVPLILVAVIVGTTAFHLVVGQRMPLATSLVLVVGLSATFLPLYYVLPDRDLSVSEVLPGVVVAAVGWMLLQRLFGVYVALAGASVGSVVGAVMLSLTWFYFGGIVLLVGCVVNAVHGGYHQRRTGGD